MAQGGRGDERGGRGRRPSQGPKGAPPRESREAEAVSARIDSPRIGTLSPGPRDSIADVAGVTVGHVTLAADTIQTGVTVVRPHAADPFGHPVPAAAVVINGFGKTAGLMQLNELGALQSPITLTNTFAVGTMFTAMVKHAVACNPSIGRAEPTPNPVVAECNDGRLNDLQAFAVDEGHYRSAFDAARVDFAQGAVGAGRGMSCFGLKGGIGSASRIARANGWERTVGGLVLANFGRLAQLIVRGVPIGRTLADAVYDVTLSERGSIIVVLATDAPLDHRQLRRLAMRAAAGIARMGSSFGHGSGDIAIAFATIERDGRRPRRRRGDGRARTGRCARPAVRRGSRVDGASDRQRTVRGRNRQRTSRSRAPRDHRSGARLADAPGRPAAGITTSMKVLVSVDIEGVAGVVHPAQTRPGNAEYERARHHMTAEANAAISGAFDGGASAVIVNDSHGEFRNLLAGDLDSRAEMLLGKPRDLGMMAGIDQDCSAAFLVGWHAKARTAGVLAHTINSFAFARVSANGVETGEAGIYGAVAAEYGVPVALITGDDVFVAETAPSYPGASTVTVKRAHGNRVATSLAPEAACAAIREGARDAALRCVTLKPRLVQTQVTLRVEATSAALADLFAMMPIVRRVDAMTVEWMSPTMRHAVRVLNSLSAMSTMLR